MAYISEELTPDDIRYFKYAPITSADVEMSFPCTRIFFRTTENVCCENILNDKRFFNTVLTTLQV